MASSHRRGKNKTPISLQIRLDWSEMDMFGHINNVSFFKYMQAARVHYWEQVGINELHKKTSVGPMLAKGTVDFKKPLFFPGNIIVYSKLLHLGTTSFVLNHELRDEYGEISAIGEDVIVLFDFEKNKKQTIPQVIREAFKKVEGKEAAFLGKGM